MLKKLLNKLHQATDFENRRVILDLLESDKFAKVLDCGCGEGNFTLELGKRIGAANLYGIEIADEFRGLPEERGVTVYIADLNGALPIDDESFDVVVASQVIEHIYRTDGFVREIHRVLKPGGYAVMSTPNLASHHNIFFLLLGLQPFPAKVSDEVASLGNRFDPEYKVKRDRNYPAHSHLRLFTASALKELFQYHGFKVEKISGVGYYPFPNSVARIAAHIDPRHAVYLTTKIRKP